MKQLYLFSTSHCHLCENAQALLMQLTIACKLEVIEISEDAILLSRYGPKIPVLLRRDTQTELNWPFTTDDIVQFLN